MSLFSLALLLQASLSTARVLPQDGFGIVKLPVITVQKANINNWQVPPPNEADVIVHDGLVKRQGDVALPREGTRSGTLYMVNVGIGSPPQNFLLQIDTVSSDTWVSSDCRRANNPNLCKSHQSWNREASSSWVSAGSSMRIAYGTGIVEGEYLKDTFTLADSTIKFQQFGYASSGDIPNSGILGVGLIMNGPAYPAIISQLAIQNITNSPAFSLDLGSVDTEEGSIIFGGIDTRKFTGALEKLPIIPAFESPDGTARYWIHLNSVGSTFQGAASSSLYTDQTFEQPIFLDSGSTFSRLPAELLSVILAGFPGATPVVSKESTYYLLGRKYANQGGTIDFGFGKTTIHVPLKQLIWTENGHCWLSIVATTGNQFSLGATFLRSAFVVFDQGNQNVFLANSANCGTNIVMIGIGSDAVSANAGECSSPKVRRSIPASKPAPSSVSEEQMIGSYARPNLGERSHSDHVASTPARKPLESPRHSLPSADHKITQAALKSHTISNQEEAAILAQLQVTNPAIPKVSTRSSRTIPPSSRISSVHPPKEPSKTAKPVLKSDPKAPSVEHPFKTTKSSEKSSRFSSRKTGDEKTNATPHHNSALSPKPTVDVVHVITSKEHMTHVLSSSHRHTSQVHVSESDIRTIHNIPGTSKSKSPRAPKSSKPKIPHSYLQRKLLARKRSPKLRSSLKATETEPASVTSGASSTSTTKVSASAITINQAIGGLLVADFTTNRPAPGFNVTNAENVQYSSHGATFFIKKAGDGPRITSTNYLFFGKVAVSLKPILGAGLLTTFRLVSDNGDEINWDWFGYTLNTVQTSFVGKGNFVSADTITVGTNLDAQNIWHVYTINWTAQSIQWYIDSILVRTVLFTDTQALGGKSFPQTPMRVILGVSIVCPNKNAPLQPSTRVICIQTGGSANYPIGPFSMSVSGITIQDYGCAAQYAYTDNSGNWESIKSIGGCKGNQVATPSLAVTTYYSTYITTLSVLEFPSATSNKIITRLSKPTAIISSRIIPPVAITPSISSFPSLSSTSSRFLTTSYHILNTSSRILAASAHISTSLSNTSSHEKSTKTKEVSSFSTTTKSTGIPIGPFGTEPTCAIPCLTAAWATFNCGINDKACQCAAPVQKALQTIMQDCLLRACNPKSLILAAAALKELCAGYPILKTKRALKEGKSLTFLEFSAEATIEGGKPKITESAVKVGEVPVSIPTINSIWEDKKTTRIPMVPPSAIKVPSKAKIPSKKVSISEAQETVLTSTPRGHEKFSSLGIKTTMATRLDDKRKTSHIEKYKHTTDILPASSSAFSRKGNKIISTKIVKVIKTVEVHATSKPRPPLKKGLVERRAKLETATEAIGDVAQLRHSQVVEKPTKIIQGDSTLQHTATESKAGVSKPVFKPKFSVFHPKRQHGPATKSFRKPKVTVSVTKIISAPKFRQPPKVKAKSNRQRKETSLMRKGGIESQSWNEKWGVRKRLAALRDWIYGRAF